MPPPPRSSSSSHLRCCRMKSNSDLISLRAWATNAKLIKTTRTTQESEGLFFLLYMCAPKPSVFSGWLLDYALSRLGIPVKLPGGMLNTYGGWTTQSRMAEILHCLEISCEMQDNNLMWTLSWGLKIRIDCFSATSYLFRLESPRATTFFPSNFRRIILPPRKFHHHPPL